MSPARRLVRSARVRASDAAQLRHAPAVPARVAEGVQVRAAALEEEVQVVLPGEPDPAVNLQRGRRHAPAGIRRVCLRHRRRQRQRLGFVLRRPARVERRRAGAFDLEEHL